MKKNDKAQQILDAAETLFLSKGYRDTSIRQIASLCNVGLGLVSYHYKNKFNLAKCCIQREFKEINRIVGLAVDFQRDVLLYHATYLQFTHWYFMRPALRQFYYECLEEGIYEEYIYETVPRTLRQLNMIYQTSLPDDYILLYGNYLPVGLEKTLVLQKRKGLFTQIQDEDIPTIVFENAVSHLVPDRAAIQEAARRAVCIRKKLASEMER